MRYQYYVLRTQIVSLKFPFSTFRNTVAIFSRAVLRVARCIPREIHIAMSLRRRRQDPLREYEQETIDDPGPESDSAGSDDVDMQAPSSALPTPEEAGQELASLLWELKHRCKLSAKYVCSIAWWAALHAGATSGPVFDMAYRPDVGPTGTGRWSEHLDNLRRHDFSEKYRLDMPGYSKASDGRHTLSVPVVPPLEQFQAEFRLRPGLAAQVAAAIRDGVLPRRYLDHPIYRKAAPGTVVHPLVLYVDGIPTTRHGGVLCVTMYHWITKVRHLVCVLRKADLCRCGCRAWCSVFSLMLFLRWQIESMAHGHHPTCRHDGSPFEPEGFDIVRQSLKGTALGWVGCVVGIKCDLMEFVSTFALPAVSSATHCCPYCCVSKSQLADVSGLSPLGSGFAVKNFGDFEAACAECEIEVHVDRLQFVALRGSLVYKDSARGRVVGQDFPLLGLRQFDRLEPTPSMPNTDAVDAIDVSKEWPKGVRIRLVFWRRSSETLVRHRNPLWSQALGCVPSLLTVDFMHAFSLGIAKVFCAYFCWSFIDANVWGFPAVDDNTRVHGIVTRLESRLFLWYSSERRAGHAVDSVEKLTVPMLGTREKPRLALQAAETNTFLRFVAQLLEEYGDRIADGPTFRSGVGAALRMLDLYRAAKKENMSLHSVQAHDCGTPIRELHKFILRV